MATAVAGSTLTEQQQKAIETRDVSVALSAGAGCGKTFVLTQRFLSHLEPDGRGDASGQLGRLIAITFTERAAREMRQRIRSGVRDRLLNAEPAHERHWLEILRRIDSAKISTIHSFCGSLLRAHAVEAELDPGFKVLEPIGAETLLDELIDDRLRELLAAHDADMIELTAGYDLRGVRERVAKLVGERFRLKFEEWLPLKPQDLVGRWVQFHTEYIRPQAIKDLRQAPVVRRLAEQILPQGAPQPVLAERAVKVADVLHRIADEEPSEADLDTLATEATVKGCAVRNRAWLGKEELYASYRDAFKDLRDLVENVRERLTFDAAGSLIAAEATLRFVRVAAPVRERYEARKKQLGVLDFDDLLLKAHELLTAPQHEALCKRLAKQIELLLVDECQDTDSLQMELIQALAGGELGRGKLFHVGDFKQSIYRFRGAQPEVFRDLQRDTPKKGRLPLSLNFRSQPAILDFANSLFVPHFGTDQALTAKRSQSSPLPAIEFLWACESAESAGDGAADDSPNTQGEQAVARVNVDQMRSLEADWLARRIRGLVDSEEPRLPADRRAGVLRPVQFGDIAVLFRALSNVGIYESALERYGIPYYVVGGKAFYAQQEVYDVLNFLRTLDSTCDDVALAGVLRSPFFSLTDESLLILSQHAGGLAGGLFAPEITEELSGEERRRAEFAARTLSQLRELKNRLPIAELLNEILARTAYDAVVTAEFLGDRKLANLRKLVDQARAFDRSGIFTLTAFIEQLSTSVVEQPDEAPAAAFAEGANVVRLMSIHQAKGLEFPVVIVPDLERKRQHNRANIAFDDKLGPVVNAPFRESLPSGIDLYRQIENAADEEESRRLFYVAVTRAADYLILSSGVNDPADAQGEWRKMLAERFDLMTGKLAGTPAENCGRPEILVTLRRPELSDDAKRRRTRPEWAKLLAQIEKKAASGKARLRLGTEPVEWSPAARRRYSFSRLSGRLLSTDAAQEGWEEAEAAADEGRLDARTLGVLVHDVLATWDYRTPAGELPATIEKLVRRHARGANSYCAADVSDAVGMIERFLRSPRGEAVAHARRVHRELEFLMSWPPKKSPDEGIYLQGFLDLLYEDADGRWCLVDYKSHQTAGDDVAKAAKPYELQLAVYALACESVLGRAPDELVLFFLRSGREHRLAWNDAKRGNALEAVNRGLAEAVS